MRAHDLYELVLIERGVAVNHPLVDERLRLLCGDLLVGDLRGEEDEGRRTTGGGRGEEGEGRRIRGARRKEEERRGEER